MKCVYVLMYWSDEDGMVNVPTGERTPPKLKPYAVFEDSITAERMKRDGDEIVKVPYFEDKSNNLYTTSPNSIHVVPCNDHTTVTYQGTDAWDKWGKESSTLAPFPPPNYPRVTCQKTVDEHSWTNRVD